MFDREFDPLALLYRHRFRAMVAVVAVLLLTLVITAFSEKEFESEAKLQVQIGRESVALDPTATIGAFVGIADSREMEIQAIHELILSRQVLGKTVDRIGVDKLLGQPKFWTTTPAGASWIDSFNLNPLRVYDRRAKAIRKLQLDLKLDVPRNSKILSLHYVSTDPEQAHYVLETLIDVTIDEHLQVNRNDESRRFFEAEAERLHERVMEFENRLSEEKKTTGISSIDQQRRLLLEQIAKFQDDIARCSARQVSVSREIEVRTAQLEKLSRTQTKSQVTGTANNPELEMQVEMFRLELREKELAAKFSDNNEQLRQIREQLKLAREAMKQTAQTRQVTEGVNEERSRYEVALLERQAELAENESRLGYLKTELIAARASLDEFDRQSSRISDLERELSLADSAYRKYKESLEIARIEQKRFEERISNLRVMQAPSFSEQPTSPRVIVNFLLGGFTAVLAAAGVAVWSDRRREQLAVAGIVGRDASGQLDARTTMRRESLQVRTP